MKEFDYSSIPEYKFYTFAVKTFGPLFRKLYNIKYKGTENIPVNTLWLRLNFSKTPLLHGL